MIKFRKENLKTGRDLYRNYVTCDGTPDELFKAHLRWIKWKNANLHQMLECVKVLLKDDGHDEQLFQLVEQYLKTDHRGRRSNSEKGI